MLACGKHQLITKIRNYGQKTIYIYWPRCDQGVCFPCQQKIIAQIILLTNNLKIPIFENTPLPFPDFSLSRWPNSIRRSLLLRGRCQRHRHGHQHRRLPGQVLLPMGQILYNFSGTIFALVKLAGANVIKFLRS